MWWDRVGCDMSMFLRIWHEHSLLPLSILSMVRRLGSDRARIMHRNFSSSITKQDYVSVVFSGCYSYSIPRSVPSRCRPTCMLKYRIPGWIQAGRRSSEIVTLHDLVMCADNGVRVEASDRLLAHLSIQFIIHSIDICTDIVAMPDRAIQSVKVFI